ncbi:MAG: TolC family protein, partial [Candidatus Eremiobacteraeota bacterium]|nr:TolC family protein [Candidatus Eremiobacteraeota bacterium]
YDRSRHWTVRSREIEETISELKADSERRAVTVLTSATYIQLLEAREATRVSRSDLEVAQRLMELASDQERAGIAAGVDVTRAQTRLAERELQLEQDREKVRTTQRRLLRLTGLPLTGELLLQDDLLHLPNPFPPVDEAVALAKQNRVEIKVAEEEIALAESRFDKTRTEDDPTLDFVADAGLAGNTPFSNSTFIHNVGLSLNIPLYDGGLTREQSKAAESRIEQARLEREDVEIQVEEDVREAYSLLETSERSMSTAEQSIRLASEELEMARDRFAAGLTNNVEVLAAEAAFTRANYNRLDALGNYDLGLIRLAAASGQPELLLETFRQASNTERNDQ